MLAIKVCGTIDLGQFSRLTTTFWLGIVTCFMKQTVSSILMII